MILMPVLNGFERDLQCATQPSTGNDHNDQRKKIYAHKDGVVDVSSV